MVVRSVACFSFLLLAVGSAFAQGGQGGGFGGGGMGGAAAPVTGDETTKSLILTPGEKGEWVLDAKDGETIVAYATSRNFDPALEVVDEQSKVLASNDDIELGNQDARLLYRFEKAGKYRVWVKGYKSAAGGQFDFTLRRFVPKDAEPGKQIATALDDTGSQWFRVRGSKTNPMSLRVKSVGAVLQLDMINPSGNVDQRDFTGSMDSLHYILRATEDKDYYVRLSARGAARSPIDFLAQPVPMYRIPIGSKSEMRRLERDDVEIALVDVEPGDFIRVDALSNGPDVRVATGSLADEEETDVVRLVYASGYKGNWASHFALKKGQLALTITQSSNLPTSYQLSVIKPAKEIGASATGKRLSLGNIDYYTFAGKKGDLLEFAASSTQFDANIRLFAPGGISLSDDDDSGGGTNPKLTTLLKEDGIYFLAIGSSGMGGSGEYQLFCKSVSARPLVVGPSKSESIETSGTHVWELQAKAGQTAVLNLNSKSATLVVSVTGPNGETVARRSANAITILKFPRDGTYKVWVEASVGSGEYRIRLIDTD